MWCKVLAKTAVVGFVGVLATCAAPPHAAWASAVVNATGPSALGEAASLVTRNSVHTSSMDKAGPFGRAYDADGLHSRNLPAWQLFRRDCGKPQCPMGTVKRVKRSRSTTDAPTDSVKADILPAESILEVSGGERDLLGGEYGFDLEAFFAQMEESAGELGPFVDEETLVEQVPDQPCAETASCPFRMRVATVSLWQALENASNNNNAETTAPPPTAEDHVAKEYVAQVAVYIAADSTTTTDQVGELVAEDDTPEPPAPPLWVGNAVVTLVLIRSSGSGASGSAAGSIADDRQTAARKSATIHSSSLSSESSSSSGDDELLPARVRAVLRSPPPVEEVLTAVTDMQGIATFRSSYPTAAKDEPLVACVRSVEFPANPAYFVFDPTQDPKSCFTLGYNN